MDIAFHIPAWLLYAAGGVALVMAGFVLGFVLMNAVFLRNFRPW